MMLANPSFDGASLFHGSSFMPTQAPDPSSSSTKNHGPQSMVPLTVKQIAGSYSAASDEVESNFRLLGLMMNKVERPTDVSFWLDDGTGRIEITRWISIASDSVEMAAVQDGMYVHAVGHMKEFQGKRQAVAYSVRPVTDFDEIALHFIECIYVNLEKSRLKLLVGGALNQFHSNQVMPAPFANTGGYQSSHHNQVQHQNFSAYSGAEQSESEVFQLVLSVFQEPAVLAREHGLHIDEVVRGLRLPRNKIVDAISYLVDVGHIYSTVDEYHFKSATNV